MSQIDLPKIYNPQNQTKKELIDNFVVRLDIFKEIFNDIKSSKMQHPEQHYIIQGVRGQGKTTLLLRIAYEIENEPKLNKKLITVVFNEEQYSINKLFKLWEATAEYLNTHTGFEDLYDRMRDLEFDDDYENRCFQLIEKYCKHNKKKLILFIDNIDAMFGKFTKKEHHRFREVLIESAKFRIIGASSVSLEFHYDYGKPFYEFFRMPQLKSLSLSETRTLLLSLGKYYKRARIKEIVKNQSGRIEALRRTTGGVIRTIILLYGIFADREEENAFQDLEKILDEVTPLYKHRMDNLSTQQQEIVDFIAINWDAVSTKEIAQKTRIKSKAVSSQLKFLQKNHIIEKQETKTKNNLYRLSERFFNIWYLMRHGGKKEETKVRWLVEFLQIWCDEMELENRTKKQLEAIQKGKIYDKQALYMTEALARATIKRELQDELIKKTRNYLQSKQSELLLDLSYSDKELKNRAIESFNVEKDHSEAMFNLAQLYRIEFKDFKKAEDYYLKAIEKGNSGAMNSLAWMYYENKSDKIKALKYAKKGYTTEKNIYIVHTYAMILLWNDEIEKALEISRDFMESKKSYEKISSDIRDFLMLLIAKKQYHTTLKIFNENPFSLKDRYKPVYYALMYFLQDEYPNEYRKMGSELKETVEEIIKKIGQLEKDYK